MLQLLILVLGVAFALDPPGRWFDRIFIMQFENVGFHSAAANQDWMGFARKGTLLTQYYAVTHPSQPNYWAQAAGSFFGINDDGDHVLPYTNIVDKLESSRVSWKSYQENYPGNCFLGSNGLYMRKHNPFISFTSVHRNSTRCAKIVNSDQLDRDLASGNLPQYMYYTPNMDNDGHDTGVDFAGRYLTQWWSKRLKLFPTGTLIVVTWDEDWFADNNRVYTVLIGDMMPSGAQDAARYSHYSLLRTVEDNWNLGTLGRGDATSVPFDLIERKRA